jgi:hypothetical protein
MLSPEHSRILDDLTTGTDTHFSRGLPRQRRTIEQRFEDFDSANPHVFELFKRFALELLVAGRSRYGANDIISRIRWDTALRTTGDRFKINNDFARPYAQKLVANDARFKDFFEFRGDTNTN